MGRSGSTVAPSQPSAGVGGMLVLDKPLTSLSWGRIEDRLRCRTATSRPDRFRRGEESRGFEIGVADAARYGLG